MKSTDPINHQRSNQLSRPLSTEATGRLECSSRIPPADRAAPWRVANLLAANAPWRGLDQSASPAHQEIYRRPLPSRPPSTQPPNADERDLRDAGSLVCLPVPSLHQPLQHPPAPPARPLVCVTVARPSWCTPALPSRPAPPPRGQRRPLPAGPPPPPAPPPPPPWSRSRAPLAAALPLSLSVCLQQPRPRRRRRRFTAPAPGWSPSRLLPPPAAACRRSPARCHAGRCPAGRQGWLASARTPTTTRRWACRVQRRRRRLRSRFGNSPASTTLCVCVGGGGRVFYASVARVTRAGRQLGLCMTFGWWGVARLWAWARHTRSVPCGSLQCALYPGSTGREICLLGPLAWCV